jgi:16S rRNA (guanine966-N2)-methyltransferase
MRIIAGVYRGRKLKSPPSDKTRPTSDRLRETLFNVLAPRIKGARFLDLCAGTGAVGIEALSRGANQVTFVDQSRKMCALIQENLEALKIESAKVNVVSAAATTFVNKVGKQREPSLTVGLMPRSSAPFDIIYFDPPYDADYDSVLNLIAEHAAALLSRNAVMIVEHHKKKDLPAEIGSVKCYRTLKQGDSVLSFFKHAA